MHVPCTIRVSPTMPFPVFTPEQYQEILNLIIKEPPSQEAAANMAGPLQWQDEGIGEEKDGLYLLQPIKQPSPAKASSFSVSQPLFSTAPNSQQCTSSNPPDSCSIWHLTKNFFFEGSFV